MSSANGHTRQRVGKTVDVTETGMLGRDLAPGDIAQLVTALLVSIERGELEASPREVEFLSSIGNLLTAGAA
jgi:hypothetical protein